MQPTAATILPPRVCAAMLCALWSSVAFAQSPAPATEEPNRAVLLPFLSAPEVPAELAVRFTSAVRGQLKAQDRFEYVSPWSAPGAAPEALPRDARLARVIDQARERIREHAFPAAAQLLNKAIERALSDPSKLDFERVREAQLWLAVAYFRGRDAKHARATLVEIFRLQPDYALPPGAFPAVFRRELARARKAVKKIPRATLSVVALKDAVITVDGRAVGNSAVKIPVFVGRHFVQVQKGGAVAAATVKVEPRKGARISVVPKFSASQERLAAVSLEQPRVDAAFVQRLSQLTSATRSDAILMGVVMKDGEGGFVVNGAVYLSRDRALHPLPRMAVTGELEGLDGNALTWVRLVDALLGAPSPAASLPLDLGTRPSRTALPPAESDTATAAVRPAWTPQTDAPPAHATAAPKRGGIPWWVWTAAGVAVAGGGTYAAVRYLNRPVTGTVTATW